MNRISSVPLANPQCKLWLIKYAWMDVRTGKTCSHRQLVIHVYMYMTAVHVTSNGYCVCREDGMESMSLEQFMSNQRCILHGGDYRCFKYQPKVCVCVCAYVHM